jgi:hypothetical protein
MPVATTVPRPVGHGSANNTIWTIKLRPNTWLHDGPRPMRPRRKTTSTTARTTRLHVRPTTSPRSTVDPLTVKVTSKVPWTVFRGSSEQQSAGGSWPEADAVARLNTKSFGPVPTVRLLEVGDKFVAKNKSDVLFMTRNGRPLPYVDRSRTSAKGRRQAHRSPQVGDYT